MYNLIFGLIGRRKDNPMPKAGNDEALANDFLDYFMGKIEKIRNDLDTFELYDPSSYEKCLEQFSFKSVSEQDVLKVIMNSKPTTCPSDPVPSKLIKEFVTTFLPLITRIVNLSLLSGTFATEWKTAVVRPLLKKKGLDIILQNYRPVSNLPYISKIVEKCALNQFMKYLESHRLLPDYQSAYRRGFSTETALLKLVSDILWNMGKGHVTALTALDLSAAFDTVDHTVLCNLLSFTFGVSAESLPWFITYLSSRNAEVHINSSRSNPRAIDFSVPQGSICGPVLYTVYASTLENYIGVSDVSLIGYADDHSTYLSFDPNDSAGEQEIIQSLEDKLVKVNTWMNLNRLKLNPDKTEFILFGSRQQLNKCKSKEISVVDAGVGRSNCIKYLGGYLDEQMNLKRFVSDKCKTISMNINHIRQIRPYLTEESCKQLVQTLITGHLDYANSLLFGLPENTIKP